MVGKAVVNFPERDRWLYFLALSSPFHNEPQPRGEIKKMKCHKCGNKEDIWDKHCLKCGIVIQPKKVIRSGVGGDWWW